MGGGVALSSNLPVLVVDSGGGARESSKQGIRNSRITE